MDKADFATVSIGGNDAGFYKLLDGCIYKFQGPFAHNCEDELANAKKVIASDEFKDTYNDVMDAIVAKNPADTFRVFANGYSPFFDDDLTEECSSESLGYWGLYQPKLTIDVRKKVNEVCNQLNDQIAEAIKSRKDDKVIYVNFAPRFKSHRFCKPGKGIEDGDNTWFFDIESRNAVEIGGIDTKTCQQKAEASGDWGEQAKCAIAIAHAEDPTLEPRVGEISTSSSDLTGPGTARVFHPKPQGYEAIVSEIESVWPYTSKDKSGAKPKTHCSSTMDHGGSVEVLMDNVSGFCHRDFSVNQDQSFIDGEVEYMLQYENPGSGYCIESNCKSSFKSAMQDCEYNSHSIYKKGTVSIPCGKFSWAITTAPAPSNPSCGHYDLESPVEDVKNINKQLNEMGDSEVCCSDCSGGCVNIASSGNVAVDLCAKTTTKLCVGCGRLGNYVAGMINECKKDGIVGGTQDVVEAAGLTVQI